MYPFQQSSNNQHATKYRSMAMFKIFCRRPLQLNALRGNKLHKKFYLSTAVLISAARKACACYKYWGCMQQLECCIEKKVAMHQ